MSVKLYPSQLEAVEKMHNGCILCGDTGTGKSITSLAYYYLKMGGEFKENEYVDMKAPKDLYIITTAKKRDEFEWEGELNKFLLSSNPELNHYRNKVVVDSWNNIQKYSDVIKSFFIFDEQRLVGYGAWVKAFLKIARAGNEWILLSATPGDKWEDYMPVFIANGFYRNKSEFSREHLVFSRFSKYPKVERYIGTKRLERLRNATLVDMSVEKRTIPIHEDIYVDYDLQKYRFVVKNRWNPYVDEPINQASGLCYVLRQIVNSDADRQLKVLEIFEKHPKVIIFYNFDYELDILRSIYYGENVEIAEWNGHKHQPIPDSDKWVYLVQYTAGAEGWNCIRTDTIIFYSQTYSYKTLHQSCGRIDRLNSPFKYLYYYHLKSKSSIDIAISRALRDKKKFNERKWTGWEK